MVKDLKAGGVFLDIGANIGTTSIHIAKRFKELKVIAFEPDPCNYRFLEINRLLNNCNNVKTENVGLSDSKQLLQLNVCPTNRGKNSVVSSAETSKMEKVTIDTITLDEYCFENNLSYGSIKYIWMDAEGFEPNIVVGMKDLLKSNHIPIFMEFTPYLMNDEMFYKMNMVLASAYSGFISISMKTDLLVEHKTMEELKKLYDSSRNEQYNLFLF